MSPVGDLLAYRDEQSRLAVYEIRTGRTRLLADKLPADQSRMRMVWSQDGSQIAYNRNATGDQIELRLAALDGRPARVVTVRDWYVAPLAWSPDSARVLVVIERGSTDEIAWVSVASGETRLVTRLRGAHRNEWHPKAILSPDGQQVAFAKLSGTLRTAMCSWPTRMERSKRRWWSIRQTIIHSRGPPGINSCSPAIERAVRICGPFQCRAGPRRGFRSESVAISDLSGRWG